MSINSDFTERLEILNTNYQNTIEPWAVELNKIVITCSINQSNSINVQHYDENMRLSSINILYNIARHGGTATQTELTQTQSISKQALTLSVNALEEKGFVYRTEDPNDHRKKVICLSDKGLAFLEDTQEKREYYFQELGQWISEEDAKQAISTLKRLNDFYKDFMSQY